MGNNVNGIINVYKEAGYTSFDVVAKLRGIVHQRKIGHTGTLDPDATGVLPVCLGNATKLVDMMTDKHKKYIATLRLGMTTDTLDISGKVLSTDEVNCSEQEVRQVIGHYLGDIMQIPPMYSALKVDGKKLYELAREGKEVERKPRPVTIYQINILEINNPEIKIEVECSKGTYIRTLCDDIGRELGCGAVMTSLIRTMSGQFSIDEAYTLKEIEEFVSKDALSDVLVPVDSIFSGFASARLDGETLRLATNGNKLRKKEIAPYMCENGNTDKVRLYDSGGRFFAVYEQEKNGNYKVFQMFPDIG